MDVALEREMETFHKALPSLLTDEGNRGKYVLIHADKVDSVWDTFDAALEAGYDRFGSESFLAKEITDHEEPQYFSRNITRCP